MKTTTAIILVFLCAISCYSQKYCGELAPVEFKCSTDRMGHCVHMFETKQQLLDFLEIKKGEVVAEIGAGDGINIGIMSMLTDSVNYYAEDIDAKTLKQKNLGKTLRYYNKRRDHPQTNTFHLVLGTLQSTNLTDGAFDKILVINSFHDFDKKDEMIDDMSKKLKPNGQLIILDGFAFVGDTPVCRDYGVHVLTTLDVEISRFEKHGFYVNKMRSPDHNAAHYGNAFVLERNLKKSKDFYNMKAAVDPLVSRSFRLSQKSVASDWPAVKEITDSLLPQINDITDVYKEYEVWLKDAALRYMRNADYLPAINIMRANTVLFPSSSHAFYWLGLAYQENKQYDLAMQNFKLSLAMQPANELCTKRIKALEKSKS